MKDAPGRSGAVRLHLGGGGNSLALAHGRDALVVDPKFGPFAPRLERKLEVDGGRTVRRVVLTHSHLDHSGGTLEFAGVRAVLAHPNTRRRLEQQGGRWEALPYVDVTGEVTLLLGGREVVVRHLGPAHTDGDLVVWLPGEKLVATGDLVNGPFEPYADAELGGQVLGLRPALEAMLEWPFEWAMPGHGDPVPRAEVERLRDELAALEAQVRRMRGEGLSEDEVARRVRVPGKERAPIPGRASREANARAMYRALNPG